MDNKIAKALDLLRKRSISAFEVYSVSSDSIRAESKELTMGSLVRSNESGISLRILMDDAMGFSYGTEATQDLIDAAITSAQYQFKDESNRLPDRQEGYAKIETFHGSVSGLAADECISNAISLEQSARDADARIHQVRKASFSRSVSEIRIVNSLGVDVSSKISFVSASIMVMATQDGDSQSGYEFDFSHDIGRINVARVGAQAAKRATDMLLARKIQTIKLPVLFDNSTTAQMLEFISDAFIGENVIKGKSYLRNKMGEKIFSGQITLFDNPLDERAADACPFDGEGVKSNRTELVKNGVVLAFVYDSFWGSAAKKPSTGNSVRGGYRSAPSTGIRHLCMEPGSRDINSELKGLKQVLKITDIMGMHTANPITGEFSVGVSGILMEGDRPLYPIREAAISGNLYELFSRVAAVGTDMREFGHVLCPSLLIESIDVSAQ